VGSEIASMNDVIYVLLTLGFFGLACAYCIACEHL
jgi:hypothetical protein